MELFSGIGSQAKAFERLGVDFEVLNTCEWDFHSILAYERIHNRMQPRPEIEAMSKAEVLNALSAYTLSTNGKAPLSPFALRGMTEQALKAILTAIRNTNNFVSITDVHSADMPEDIDLMTYSFPCQDLSFVGAFHGYQNGIDRNAGTRSGMLWEVERILWEMKNDKKKLPRFLLLENVTALLTRRHKANFDEWQTILNELGYFNKIYCLNALDFGLPQNRYRLFMLSIYTGNEPAKEEYLRDFFETHNLEDPAYRSTLNLPVANLADYLRLDYQNETYYREAVACQPCDTPSRRKIWEGNPRIVDETGEIVAAHVATLTTKQDRDPNSGNLYMAPHDGLGNYRYLTPRECIMLMGFDEADYESLINNNVLLKERSYVFARDRVIRMAGNSIAVNVLVEVFRQMLQIKDAFYPAPGRRRTDVHTPEQRRHNMQQIKAKHTEPEEHIAHYLYRNGFRGYRRNVKYLPGTPDFVLSRYNTVIFVNGCFWHGHEGCRYFKYPQTNEEFWKEKIDGNRTRDQKKIEELRALGWRVIVVWECELKDNTDETLARLANDIRNQQ